METSKLRRFAQYARRSLTDQVKAKLALVLAADSAARRESPSAVAALVEKIAQTSEAQLVDKVTYTWFNRFCALRFMDVNGYSRSRVVSPADESQFQPEILADAKMGHIDAERVPEKTRLQVAALLSGSATSRDPQQEAYRLLVVAECNSFHKAMPYLFERIADYTELLMPDDLLSGNSILSYTREAMTPDACQDVEVIGWLYQFYISEKKDQVFDGLKKGRKISAADIPAATQLFTPHWIVRYLVENSLGRLWMLNHPGSGLIGQMDYYIKSEQAETDFLRIQRPEDIKVCDPACGSGHMLTYAFDLLYAIYEEVGTDASEIPTKILTHNLYGIELDERAGDLAAFALTMKARARQRRFFDKAVEPNICVLEKVEFDAGELDDYMTAVGHDLFTLDLRDTLQQFAEADNFGSLIRPKLSTVNDVLPLLAAKDLGGQLFLTATHDKVLKALHQTDYLSQKYQVVVANPPYMGSKGMNASLGAFAKLNYPDSKADLFSMFIERNLDLAVPQGAVGMITMQSWMFLSSFQKMRSRLLNEKSIISMAHLGPRAFDSIGGEVVSTVAFILSGRRAEDFRGVFIDLVNQSSEAEKDRVFREAIKTHDSSHRFSPAVADFKRIPGFPIAYWMSSRAFELFAIGTPLREYSKGSTGLQTSDSANFLRLWHEPSASKIGGKWIRFAKGGGFRKWYGNVEHVVNWENKGASIKRYVANKYPYLNGNYALVVKNEATYFSEGLLTSRVTSGALSFRIKQSDEIYADACTAIFPNKSIFFLAILSTKLLRLVQELNPTINFQAGDIEKFPVLEESFNVPYASIADACISLARNDWNSFETSWAFGKFPLLDVNISGFTFENAYAKLRVCWKEAMLEMQRLEQENNSMFIGAYGLEAELCSSVPLDEIGLTCNPNYRFQNARSDSERESRLLEETVSEFISYAVGCMFGRYSLDKPGLILANAGDTLVEYFQQVPKPSFTPDADNVIPMLDGDWFTDDATERCRSFLRVTFGEEKYQENLRFIEDALGKDLRKYMVKDFYNDHVKRYKKRPIYWLFASPKGTFNALVYLHRYRPDTVSVVLKYLREFKEKLAARRAYLDQVSLNPSASQGEKTKALKENDLLKKQLLELDDYERDVLFPLASQQIALDLDDGVKVNYLKLGPALKKITGLDAKEED